MQASGRPMAFLPTIADEDLAAHFPAVSHGLPRTYLARSFILTEERHVGEFRFLHLGPSYRADTNRLPKRDPGSNGEARNAFR